MDAEIKEVEMGMGRKGVRFQDEGREWRLPDYLVLGGESEEDLREMTFH